MRPARRRAWLLVDSERKLDGITFGQPPTTRPRTFSGPARGGGRSALPGQGPWPRSRSRSSTTASSAPPGDVVRWRRTWPRPSSVTSCFHYRRSIGPVDLPTVGLEALVRWQHRPVGSCRRRHPSHRTDWAGVVRSAANGCCMPRASRAARWQRRRAALRNRYGRGVDVSPRQLDDPRLPAVVAAARAGAALAPGSLVLELTESALLPGDATLHDALTRLRSTRVFSFFLTASAPDTPRSSRLTQLADAGGEELIGDVRSASPATGEAPPSCPPCIALTPTSDSRSSPRGSRDVRTTPRAPAHALPCGARVPADRPTGACPSAADAGRRTTALTSTRPGSSTPSGPHGTCRISRTPRTSR